MISQGESVEKEQGKANEQFLGKTEVFQVEERRKQRTNGLCGATRGGQEAEDLKRSPRWEGEA